MQIILRGVGTGPRLAEWEGRPFWPAALAGPGPRDRRDRYERLIATEAPGPPVSEGPFQRAAAAILRYDIFPPTLVSGVLRRTPVEPGDTVGICYHGPLGIDLFFAARVVDRFTGRAPTGGFASGFTYRTLIGHPELGEETFSVEKDEARGEVRVALRSWSRPGTWLARAGAPLVRALQVHASRAALRHLAAIVLP